MCFGNQSVISYSCQKHGLKVTLNTNVPPETALVYEGMREREQDRENTQTGAGRSESFGAVCLWALIWSRLIGVAVIELYPKILPSTVLLNFCSLLSPACLPLMAGLCSLMNMFGQFSKRCGQHQDREGDAEEKVGKVGLQYYAVIGIGGKFTYWYSASLLKVMK